CRSVRRRSRRCVDPVGSLDSSTLSLPHPGSRDRGPLEASLPSAAGVTAEAPDGVYRGKTGRNRRALIGASPGGLAPSKKLNGLFFGYFRLLSGGSTSNVRSSLQSVQASLTSARTFQRHPSRLGPTM